MEENTMKRDLVEEVKKAKKTETNETVSVGCSIPMGVEFNLSKGKVVLNGVPMTHLVSATKIGTPLPAGKYGVTTIQRSQWEEILRIYGGCDFIQNGAIFAEKTADEVMNRGTAYYKEGKRSGFEQAKKRPKAKTFDEE